MRASRRPAAPRLWSERLDGSLRELGARLVDIDRPENTALQDHGIDFRLFATAW